MRSRKKGLHRLKAHRLPAARQGTDDLRAVIRVGVDAGVEQRDDAAVGFGADEAARSLTQRQGRVIDLQLLEGIAAARGDQAFLALQHRIVMRQEGHLVQDHQ